MRINYASVELNTKEVSQLQNGSFALNSECVQRVLSEMASPNVAAFLQNDEGVYRKGALFYNPETSDNEIILTLEPPLITSPLSVAS